MSGLTVDVRRRERDAHSMHFIEDHCANCDTPIPRRRSTSLFCTDHCFKTADFVQWERIPRTIQDLANPGYQWALEARVLFARRDGEDSTTARHRLLDELDDRINSPVPLRWCDCPEWKPDLTQRLIKERKLRRDAAKAHAKLRVTIDFHDLTALTRLIHEHPDHREITELVKRLHSQASIQGSGKSQP